MKKYCAAPWHGLHINPRGDIKTCCAGNPNLLGNLSTHTVFEVLNSDRLIEVRRLMKEGIFHPDYCQNCIKGSSEYKWHNDMNEFFDISQAGDYYISPTIIDARWNTTCNQTCNYCDSASSSSWAALTNTSVRSETRRHTDSIFHLINKYKDSIKEIALVGGEPLLINENQKLLNSINDADTKVILITNLNVDLYQNKIFLQLKEKYRVGWSMSFDNIDKHFDYVRFGGNWKKHEKNVDEILKLIGDDKKDHTGGVHSVYNIYNCTKLNEFKDWCSSKNLSIEWQKLFGPNALDVTKQNKKIRKLAIDEIDQFLNRTDLEVRERDFFVNVREEIENSNYTDSSELVNFTNTIETKYHPETKGHFKILWPEIYNLL